MGEFVFWSVPYGAASEHVEESQGCYLVAEGTGGMEHCSNPSPSVLGPFSGQALVMTWAVPYTAGPSEFG